MLGAERVDERERKGLLSVLPLQKGKDNTDVRRLRHPWIPPRGTRSFRNQRLIWCSKRGIG